MKNMLFTDNWERSLEFQFVINDRCRKKAYVCSPLGAAERERYLANMHAARAYMYIATKQLGVAARAPHAYLPMLLSDDVPAERGLALEFGRKLLEQSELLLVCGDCISSGMKGEIRRAAELRMGICVFDENVFIAVRKLVTQAGGDKTSVVLDRKHQLLACRYPMEDCSYRGAG